MFFGKKWFQSGDIFEVRRNEMKPWYELENLWEFCYPDQDWKLNIHSVNDYIENGGDIHMKQFDGNTLLASVVDQGEMSCIQRLLSKKADVNASNFLGRNILSIALLRNHNADILEALLNANANPNPSPTFDRVPPLLYESSKKIGSNIECVKLLIQYKSDLNRKTSFGNALDYAFCIGNHDIVLELIYAGCLLRECRMETQRDAIDACLSILQRLEVTWKVLSRIFPEDLIRQVCYYDINKDNLQFMQLMSQTDNRWNLRLFNFLQNLFKQ